MRVSTVLLLLSLLCLASFTIGFNPYADDDETGKGAAPATTTVTCSVGADGVEVCESVARTNIPDEEELAAKVEAAEAERIATMEAKAKARAERNAKIDADKQARREARDKERQAKKEKQENKEQEKKHHDLFDKSKLPGAVKKMKVNYYKFFGVADDAKKMEIRRVANNMALANHPDKCPDRDDAKCIAQRKEKMIIINEAREVLLSDEKRPKYDFLLNFGFKVFDEELYNDVKKDYESGEEIVGGWGEDHPGDPSSDFSTMQLSEEAAGWVLLFCGAVAASLIAVPVWKSWENSKSAEAKKAALKKNLQSSLSKGQEKMASLKKKTEKFTGEKTAKRFDAAQ